MIESIVATDKLTKRYGTFTALNRCSVTVPRGQVFGLLGPNGAGKTTLIRTLLGFLKPTSGTGTILGMDCVKQSVAIREKVSYLPGDARLFRTMRGTSVLDFFLAMRPQASRVRANELIQRVELDASRRVGFMSTGMRQKLAIVAVLASETPLIILDEPTANLDPTVRTEILQLVREAKQRGQTVVFSSHVLSEIEEVCDTAVILRRGELVHQLRIDDLKQSHRLHAKISSRLPEIPDALQSRLQVSYPDHDHVTIDIEGHLMSVMQWCSQLDLENVRVEPRSLETVYQRFHPPQTQVPRQSAEVV